MKLNNDQVRSKDITLSSSGEDDFDSQSILKALAIREIVEKINTQCEKSVVITFRSNNNIRTEIYPHISKLETGCLEEEL